MEIHVELAIKSKSSIEFSETKIVEFCDRSKCWKYDEEKSRDLSQNLGKEIGCVVLGDHKLDEVCLSFMQSGRTLSLVNIVPRNVSSLLVSEYNQIAIRFFNEFKVYSRKKDISITRSNMFPSLDEIITAKLPRKAFLTFVNAHPLSYHPLDIGRLDKFICAVSRYSRKHLNIERLGHYLSEEKSWPKKDVDWFINRVTVGLEIIDAYKNFY